MGGDGILGSWLTVLSVEKTRVMNITTRDGQKQREQTRRHGE